LPLNIVRPTTDPHGLNTVSAVTTPVGLSGVVVVVVWSGTLVWVVPGRSPGEVVVGGGSVVTDPSG
jgi:hypothetical protein